MATQRLKIAVVGGPIYAVLCDEQLRAFLAEAGSEVDVGAQLTHPASWERFGYELAPPRTWA